MNASLSLEIKLPVLRILVLDDADFVAAMLADVLTEWGHSVACFTNATTALQALSRQPFDVILCDWNLRGTNGAAFRADAARISPVAARIIFLTGKVLDYSIRAYCLEHDCLLLTKPFTLAELTDALVALWFRDAPSSLQRAA